MSVASDSEESMLAMRMQPSTSRDPRPGRVNRTMTKDAVARVATTIAEVLRGTGMLEAEEVTMTVQAVDIQVVARPVVTVTVVATLLEPRQHLLATVGVHRQREELHPRTVLHLPGTVARPHGSEMMGAMAAIMDHHLATGTMEGTAVDMVARQLHHLHGVATMQRHRHPMEAVRSAAIHHPLPCHPRSIRDPTLEELHRRGALTLATAVVIGDDWAPVRLPRDRQCVRN